MESDTAPKLEALASSALLIASAVVPRAPATSVTPCLALARSLPPCLAAEETCVISEFEVSSKAPAVSVNALYVPSKSAVSSSRVAKSAILALKVFSCSSASGLDS